MDHNTETLRQAINFSVFQMMKNKRHITRIRQRFYLAAGAALLFSHASFAQAPFEMVIDNNSPQFSVDGTWHRSNLTTGYVGDDYLVGDAQGDSGTGLATWQFELPDPDKEYRLYAKFPKRLQFSTTASYVIYHQEGEDRVVIDQTAKSDNDLSYLGTFTGSYKIELSNEASQTRLGSLAQTSKRVVADAIKIVEKTGCLPELDSQCSHGTSPLNQDNVSNFAAQLSQNSKSAEDSVTDSDETFVAVVKDPNMGNGNGNGGGNGNGNGGGNGPNPTDELQTLSRSGATVTLSDVNGGNWGTVSIDDADADATNELQMLGGSGDTITLSNGGSFTIKDDIDDADANPTNELQSLSRAGATVTLSDGGGVVSIDDADSLPENEAQDLSRNDSSLSLSAVNGVGGGTVSINDADFDPANELQTVTQSDNRVSLSQNGGNFSIDDADASPTNELQTLGGSINGRSTIITLKNVNGSESGKVTITDNVNDADHDPANELQKLTQRGNTLTLSKDGGNVTITDNVNDADASPTNELQTLSGKNNGTSIVLTLKNANGNKSGEVNLGNLKGGLFLTDNESGIKCMDACIGSRGVCMRGIHKTSIGGRQGVTFECSVAKGRDKPSHCVCLRL